jgi:hypothetical protein
MDLEKLKEEIPYKWRVQSAGQYGAQCVAYIDARDVQDLLDKVCGVDGWQCKYYELKGNLFCSIGILDEDESNWVWKSDCGTESNVEKQKGEASDAFKRAAVMFGIGRFLYSLEIVKLPTKEKGKDFKGNTKYIPFSANQNKFGYAKEVNEWCTAIINSKK